MRRRLSKPAIFRFLLHLIAASFLASIFVVVFYQWWVFDLFSHFRIQYVLIGFLILPIILWLKKYWLAAIIVVAILFHSISLWPYLQGNRVMASLEEPENLTILFANVYYKNLDFEKITNVIKYEKPEIIIFAEVSEESFTTLKTMIQKEYPFSGFQDGEGAYDISYFSKSQPLMSEFLYFAEKNPSAFLRYEWNESYVTIIGIHPHSPMASQSTASRDKHLKAALEYGASIEGPVAVMGDFNISQFSPKFSHLLKEYGFIDTQLKFGLQPSWNTDTPPILRIPIDHVVVSPEVDVYDRYVGENTGSDHLPIVVKIRVQ